MLGVQTVAHVGLRFEVYMLIFIAGAILWLWLAKSSCCLHLSDVSLLAAHEPSQN